MQHNHPPPYPPPDVNVAWAQPPLAGADLAAAPLQQDLRVATPQLDPDFLIIGLFALRLTLRVILSLEPYPDRSADINWLNNFLASYNNSYDLAKVTGPTKQAYLLTYPAIVSRMKAEKRYPLAFMALNPVTPQRREELSRRGGMTDAERLEIIDFADAAREWGSVVHVPEAEANRMLELANQRRIADLDRHQRVDDGTATHQVPANLDHHG